MDDDTADSSICAPVCFQIDPEIEYREVPTNGHEFLLRVMEERKRFPTITKCNIRLSELSSKQSVFAKERPPIKDAPANLKPTVEWQNIQVADFSKERMYITRLLSDKSMWPQIDTNELIIELNKSGNVEASFWNNLFGSQEPTLSCILAINQNKIEKGLSALVYSLKKIPEGESIPQPIGRWIYAILAYIQLPLLSETISIMRDLARICADIRSKIDPLGENAIAEAAPMNLFICLISKYFGQMDLKC